LFYNYGKKSGFYSGILLDFEAIEQLRHLGYQYLYGPNIAPDSGALERESFEDVLLLERLQIAVGRINPDIPAEVRENAIKQILRLNSLLTMRPFTECLPKV